MKLNPAKESKFDCLLQAYSYVLYYILITVYNVVYHVQFYEISLCGWDATCPVIVSIYVEWYKPVFEHCYFYTMLYVCTFV